MNPRYELHGDIPILDRPVMVVHLHGWIDASGAAAAAMAALDSACNTKALATFDGDTFIDYRARRPTMELREGVNTKLVWNDIELKVGADSKGHAVLTLVGPEPDSQWRGFASAVTQLALQLGVYQMVALGSYPFASPHTRPTRLSSSSPSADVIADLPYLKNSVDVPAGMSAVLEHALTEAGIASLGLWVQVPHYVSAMSYPAASAALLDGLNEVTGITIDGSALASEAEIQHKRINVLVGGNDEHEAMVRQLESLYDQAEQQTLDLDRAISEMPSGDELAAEFEQFLRDQDSNDKDAGSSDPGLG
ncbi:MAG: PAC2 family protein [Ilumatobacteraceae bacterium]|nr:PAC2 family protein [Ilumatobacteraceae bacterium]